MSKDYSPEVQKLYLEILLADPETYVRVQNIFDHRNFVRNLSSAAKFINEYAQKYKGLPTVDLVNAECKTSLIKVTEIDESTTEWVLDEFETFTRHKALERAILESADLLEKGDYGRVETIIKEATQISLTKDMGISYWDNPRERIESVLNAKGQISTGWPTLDWKLHGGFNRGELEIFAAPSNGGKSLFLNNLAANWASLGLEVLFITCEMSQARVAMRMDSIHTGVGSRDIGKKIDEVELKLKMLSKKSANIQLKYLPAGKTVNDIRSFAKEFQIQHKKKFDIVIVDYLDLLMPATYKVSPENLFVKDKYVSEELRNFANDNDVVVVTASQFNRCLALDTKVIKNGEYINIIDVEIGDWIESSEGPVKVTNKYPVTKQKVYKIKTKSGKEILCSGNHLFPVNGELTSINSGLKIGDKLTTVLNNVNGNTGELNAEHNQEDENQA